jgi:heme exporter protein D
MKHFLSQGGFGFFVWSAYAMVLVLMVAEVVQLRRQRRTILTRIGRILRMRSEVGNE